MVHLFQAVRLRCNFVTPRPSLHLGQIRSHDPGRATRAGFNTRLGLGCFPFARRYSGNRGFFLFLGLLRCFSSPRWLPGNYVFIPGMMRFYRIGLPHSEISGSTLVCSYPELFAAYHVLHRLSTPRHPPSALSSLTRILMKMPVCLTLFLLSKNELESPELLSCGDDRIRTGDLRLARAALSQLSYIPIYFCKKYTHSPWWA